MACFAEPPISSGGVDDEVLTAYADAVELARDLGHRVEPVEVQLPPQTLSAFETVWAVSAASWPVDPAREGELRPLTRWLRERGNAVSGAGFAQAMVAMRQAAAAMLRTLSPYDIVVTPTLAQLPAPVGGLRNDADPAADFEAQKRFTPFTALWNVTGMPAVSLPMHWTTTGLPVGVMFAGRPSEDHVVVQLAAAVEDACTVAGRWPHPATPFTGEV
jgi:amidase